jgi:hypothetical protein
MRFCLIPTILPMPNPRNKLKIPTPGSNPGPLSTRQKFSLCTTTADIGLYKVTIIA